MLAPDGRECIDMRKETCYMGFYEGQCSKPMTRSQVKNQYIKCKTII